jgi:methionine-rich copper-binding protein CopC
MMMRKQIAGVWAIAVVAMGILGLTAGVVNAAVVSIDFDKPTGGVQSGEPTHSEGLTLPGQVGDWYQLAIGSSGSSPTITTPGGTFTFNTTGATYRQFNTGSNVLREDFFYLTSGYGPCTWTLTDLVPGGTYNIICYGRYDPGWGGYRLADMSIVGFNGGAPVPQETASTPEGDWNFEGVVADGSGKITGTFAWIKNNAEWGAIQFEYTGVIVADTNAPVISTLSPTNTATNVLVDANLVITFDETVQKGSGNIVIKESGGATFETISVDDVTFDDATVTIDPSTDLGYGTNYYVEIDSGAIQDMWTEPNIFTGITSSATWSFTTEPPDSTPPNFTTLSPASGASGVAPASNLVITFDEDVQKGSGDIVIKEVGGGTFETFAVADVDVSGSTVTINPTSDLGYGTNYYVEIANTAIKDLAVPPNSFTGFTGTAAWNFTTEMPDTTPPDYTTLSPTNNATGVGLAADLVITFSEPVQKGTGDIVIKESGGATFETISVSAVTVSDTVVTINPVGDLAPFTDYYVEIADGAIKDQGLPTPLNFGGIDDDVTWRFTTGKTPTGIGIDFGDGNWDDPGEDNANGLQILATSFGTMTGTGEQSETVDGITFTLNVGGAEYMGPYADRVEILGSGAPSKYTGPIPWSLTGLVPRATYDVVFLMYNGRPGKWTVDGVGSATPDADSDSNFEDVCASESGVISGTWDYWTVGAWCSFTALLVDKVADPIPLGMVFILK